jgi:hypothetical protein
LQNERWELFLAAVNGGGHQACAILGHAIKPTALDFGNQAMPTQFGEQARDLPTALATFLF